MTEKTTEGKVEITSVFVDAYPEWTGDTTESKKYSDEINEKKLRLDFNLPVPTSDEDAMKLYNMTLAQLIAKGVNQNSHDERILSPIVKDLHEKNTVIDEKVLQSLAKDVVTAHFRVAAERKASVVKKVSAENQKLHNERKELTSMLGLPETATLAEIQAAMTKKLKK
jgi:hypothetical protein